MITSMSRRIGGLCMLCLTLFGCAIEPAPLLTSTLARTPANTEPPPPTLIPTRIPEELRVQIRDKYLAASGPLLSEWSSTNQLANDRSRPDWLDQVNQLQAIRSNYAQLEVDPSMEALHNQLLLHMDCQMAAYFAFFVPQDYTVFDIDTDPEVIFGRCSLPVTD